MTAREQKLLADIHSAAGEIPAKTRGKSEADYLADRDLRLIVERLFLVIGEAAARLRRESPQTSDRLPQTRSAVAFRNFLIHVYDEINDRIVWRTVSDDIQPLIAAVGRLLASGGQR